MVQQRPSLGARAETPDGGGSNTGLILGVVGRVAVLALLVLLLALRGRKRPVHPDGPGRA